MSAFIKDNNDFSLQCVQTDESFLNMYIQTGINQCTEKLTKKGEPYPTAIKICRCYFNKIKEKYTIKEIINLNKNTASNELIDAYFADTGEFIKSCTTQYTKPNKNEEEAEIKEQINEIP